MTDASRLLSTGRLSRSDFAQNALLFVPVGILGMLALRSAIRGVVLRLATVMFLSLALSSLAEGLQLFTPDRIASLADIVAQAAGTAVGALVAGGTARAVARIWPGVVARGWTASPHFLPLVVAVAVVVLAGLEPFDVSIDPGAVWDKLHALMRNPWQRGQIDDEVLQALRYAALAFLALRWNQDRQQTAPAMRAFVTASLAGIALEAAQFAIESRMPGAWDVTVAAAGALLGCVVGLVRSPATPLRAWVPLVGAWSWIGGAVQMLSPFRIAVKFQAFSYIPVAAFYDSAPPLLVGHNIELALIYAPVGALLTAWRRGLASNPVAIALGAMLMQLPIEFLQGWSAGRFPSATDVITAGLLAAGGAYLATR
jgi:VanZ family protein